jgi:hypothetical protein
MAPLIGLVQNSDDIRDKVGAQNKVLYILLNIYSVSHNVKMITILYTKLCHEWLQ